MTKGQDLEVRIRAVLREFDAGVPEDTDFSRFRAYHPPTASFPVPEIVLVILRDIMHFPWSGRGEKVRWTVYCQFRGHPLAFELRKFGFAVLYANGSLARAKAALDRLRRAVPLAEGVLQPLVSTQLAAGRVTVANQYSYLNGRYKFLREKAEAAYRTPDPPPTPFRFNERGEPTAWASSFRQGPREGSYYAAAMLDAYFSKLEHVLVLILAFVDFDPDGGRLLKLVTAGWEDKYKAVFKLDENDLARRLYERMVALRRRMRNPLAHGGFDREGESLYFHLEGVGALPASMSRTPEGIHFTFIPVEAEKFADVSSLLDEVDRMLAEGSTRLALLYVNAGLDVAFDQANRQEYKAASQSLSAFEQFLDRMSYLADRHANMDY